MQPTRRAVVDVGTNSVKVLVGDIGPHGDITPVLEESHQTRLGAGFYETRRLEPERISETAETVANFAEKAATFGAVSVCVFATSAAREALNGHELTACIQERSGLATQVISGEEEAQLAFEGVTSDPRYASGCVLLNDVGGGSAQFIVGRNGRKEFAASYALGTVRLFEAVRPGDPPRPEELQACRAMATQVLQEQVRPQLENRSAAESPRQARPAEFTWVATGGTATILGCMEKQLTCFDRSALEGITLTRERLQFHQDRLWRLSLAERQRVPGLPPKRADVILSGVVIYVMIAEIFGFQLLRISTRGLRFGMLRRQQQPGA